MKVLDLTLPSPAENLACDEALLDAAESGEAGEVLRFWESRQPFVVVGYANQVTVESNVALCAAKSIPILRRCSGGGSVVQGPGCLNYALVLRITADGPTRNISATNEFIMARNRAAIQSALLPPLPEVRVRGYTDLTVGDKKFSGNSQRRRRKFLLFHGTFLWNFDLRLIGEVLLMPPRQPSYRQARAHGDFIANLSLSAKKLKEALRQAWQVDGALTETPAAGIAELVREKYSLPEWNLKF